MFTKNTPIISTGWKQEGYYRKLILLCKLFNAGFTKIFPVYFPDKRKLWSRLYIRSFCCCISACYSRTQRPFKHLNWHSLNIKNNKFVQTTIYNSIIPTKKLIAFVVIQFTGVSSSFSIQNCNSLLFMTESCSLWVNYDKNRKAYSDSSILSWIISPILRFSCRVLNK